MEFLDFHGRRIALSSERAAHIENAHPEMQGQLGTIGETLRLPDRVVLSKSDPDVELFYTWHAETPVTGKYLCVVVKTSTEGPFIITAYFTDSVKKGDVLWSRK